MTPSTRLRAFAIRLRLAASLTIFPSLLRHLHGHEGRDLPYQWAAVRVLRAALDGAGRVVDGRDDDAAEAPEQTQLELFS